MGLGLEEAAVGKENDLGRKAAAGAGAGVWSGVGIGPNDSTGPGCLPPPPPLHLKAQELSGALMVPSPGDAATAQGPGASLALHLSLPEFSPPAQPRQGQLSHFMNT